MIMNIVALVVGVLALLLLLYLILLSETKRWAGEWLVNLTLLAMFGFVAFIIGKTILGVLGIG